MNEEYSPKVLIFFTRKLYLKRLKFFCNFNAQLFIEINCIKTSGYLLKNTRWLIK